MSDGIAESAETGLKGKIGPVPVWLIAAILGVAAVIGYYVYSKRSGTAASATNGTATTDANTGTVADGSIAGTSGLGVTDSSYATTGSGAAYNIPDSTDTSSSAAPATNAGWLVSGANAVANHGSAGYVDSFVALTKYINGDTITSSQKAMVDYAISVVGYPPEGLNGISSVAADPVAAVTAPATTTTTTAPVVTTAPVTTGTTTTTPPKSTGTPVTAVNPVKQPAPTPVKTVSDPGQSKGNAATTGSKFTLEKAHKGYLTADAANAQKGSVTTVQPGTYYVYNKVTRSGGSMINLTRVKGVPGSWINP